MVDLHQYQRDLALSPDSRLILQGGRQIGKTTVVAERAKQSAGNVLIIAPSQRMTFVVKEAFDDVPEYIDINTSTSFSVMDKSAFNSYDHILIDEASHIDPAMLFTIERVSADVFLAYTPMVTPTIVDFWAEKSPYWTTVSIPTSAAPHIDDDDLDIHREQFSQEREQVELDAEPMI